MTYFEENFAEFSVYLKFTKNLWEYYEKIGRNFEKMLEEFWEIKK